MPQKRTIPRTCEQCGAPFLAKAQSVKDGNARFCTQSCGTRHQMALRVRVPLANRLWRRIDRTGEGCWEWPNDAASTNGYGVLNAGANGGTVLAHRLAWTLATGAPVPDGFDVLHACDNPPCCRNDDPGIYVIRGIARPRFGHLWLGTNADNVADRVDKGRRRVGGPTGEIHGMSRLTEDDVRAILAMIYGGRKGRDIAAEFGISEGHVSSLKVRRTWKHLAV